MKIKTKLYIPEWADKYVKYNPNVDKQYEIIRESRHDGTLIFTKQLILEVMKPVLLQTSYWTLMGEPQEDVKEIHYEIGDIDLESTYNESGFPFSTTDVMKMPVKCKYIYEDQL